MKTDIYYVVIKDYSNITKSVIDSYPVNVYGVIGDYTIYKNYEDAVEVLKDIYNKFYKETDAVWDELKDQFEIKLTNIFNEEVVIRHHITQIFVQI